MKKYWKLIALTAVIVLTIGTVYIQSSMATSKYLEFVIEHKSGNEKEVKPLTIYGNYEDQGNYLSMEISNEETSYRHDLSYVDMLRGLHTPPEIESLQKDYRNFMRGKYEQINSFFENGHVLAYVNLKSEYSPKGDYQWAYSFEIDVLDKGSKSRKKFAIPISLDERHDYVNVESVQFVNGQLKIFTVNDLVTDVEGSTENEMHVYSVDPDKQKLVSDDVIDFTTAETDANKSIDIYTVDNGYDIGANKYIVFTIAVGEETFTDDEYGNYEMIERQLIAYNVETNEQVRIELPEEFGEETYPELLSGTSIYFSKEMDDQIEVISYNLESEQIETEQTFDLPQIEEDLIRNIRIENDKIYIVNPLKSKEVDSSIIIGDAKTGKILYEGSIELDKSGEDQKFNSIDISHISVKKE